MTNYLDLKYDLVCLIVKETLRQVNGWDENTISESCDFSSIQCELSKEIDDIITKMKGN